MRRYVVAGFFAVVLAGCSHGAYDKDFRTRLQKYRQEGEFSLLHRDPKSLEGGRVLLRVPKVFTAQDDKGENSRSKPPCLQDFPGLATAFETLVEVDGAKLPAVLSVIALVDDASNVDEIKKRILAQVQKEQLFAKETWGKPEGEPGADGQSAWSVLRLVGQQSFDRVKNDATAAENVAGTTEIWVTSNPAAKATAVLVWRVPQALEATVPIAQLAGLVSRTVEMKAAAPADGPAAAKP